MADEEGPWLHQDQNPNQGQNQAPNQSPPPNKILRIPHLFTLLCLIPM